MWPFKAKPQRSLAEKFGIANAVDDGGYERLVTPRVLRLREAVMDEFRALGFGIQFTSYFGHEVTIQMAQAIEGADDEEAKRRLRPMIKPWVRGGRLN